MDEALADMDVDGLLRCRDDGLRRHCCFGKCPVGLQGCKCAHSNGIQPSEEGSLDDFLIGREADVALDVLLEGPDAGKRSFAFRCQRVGEGIDGFLHHSASGVIAYLVLAHVAVRQKAVVLGEPVVEGNGAGRGEEQALLFNIAGGDGMNDEAAKPGQDDAVATAGKTDPAVIAELQREVDVFRIPG